MIDMSRLRSIAREGSGEEPVLVTRRYLAALLDLVDRPSAKPLLDVETSARWRAIP
ncbi:hypothetical protein [Sphingobium sp. DC-2]|uniref:hypothetical protein n=1 Tax=Sphingobium sp. DC-2 TaxID=1303256 RepID=UPI000ADFB421|nr:hypothetical protein [Sphingobium sp. DC-2]